MLKICICLFLKKVFLAIFKFLFNNFFFLIYFFSKNLVPSKYNNFFNNHNMQFFIHLESSNQVEATKSIETGTVALSKCFSQRFCSVSTTRARDCSLLYQSKPKICHMWFFRLFSVFTTSATSVYAYVDTASSKAAKLLINLCP